ERRGAFRGLEQDLSARSPVRAIIALTDLLPANSAVCIGKGDREPVEARMMHHERGAAARGGEGVDIGVQPKAGLLISLGRPGAGEAKLGKLRIAEVKTAHRVAHRLVK